MKLLREWSIMFLIIITIKQSLVEVQSIPSASMNPSLEVNDFVLVNQAAYTLRLPILGTILFEFSEPKRGDVITFANEDTKVRYIKRVFGVEGDVLEFDDFKVTRNGVALECGLKGSYGEVFLCGEDGYVVANLSERSQLEERFKGKFVVPERSVFVLGDNRDFSRDSRYLPSTFISLDDVQGKAISMLFNTGSFRFGSFAIPLPFIDGGSQYEFSMYPDK